MIMNDYLKIPAFLMHRFSAIPHTYALSLIIVLAFFLRAYRLQDIPAGLYWDEIAAVYYPFLYQHGIGDLSVRVIISHILPGTYFLYYLSGSSIFLTRLPELISGTLLVFISYLLFKEMFSLRVGLISALLVSILPWAIHFSRFQAFSSAYVLYFMISLLILYKGINAVQGRKKTIYYCCGSFMLGLTAMIFTSSQVFVPLFSIIFVLTHISKKDLKLTAIFSKKRILILTIFLLTISPIFAEYFMHSRNSSYAIDYSTYSHSTGIIDWFNMIVQRSRIHLSPGFLVFTTPSSHELPFGQMIAESGLLRYTPTVHGELNYYGLLVYPGILLLFIEALFHRNRSYMVVLGWILCYSAAAGVAYYDNPNAARNIVGMPAFVITIALFMEYLIKLIYNRRDRIARIFKPILIVSLIFSVTLPTILFLYDYYVVYFAQSAKVFDYGYKQIADYLTAKGFWQKNILVNTDYSKNLSLSFFSPTQPPITPITDFGGLEINKMTATLNSNNFTFNNGWIHYDTRIDNGYIGPISSELRLSSSDAREYVSFSIYHSNSLYAPNEYLLSQAVNGTIFYLQSPVDKIIEYDKWYKIGLFFNSTTISVYLDGKLLNNWTRPSDPIYSTIRLGSESSDISFRNMTIQQAHQINRVFDSKHEFHSESKYPPVRVNMEANAAGEKVIKLWSVINDGLLVTSHKEDLQTLNNYAVPNSLLNESYYPNGTVALRVYQLDRIHPIITPHSNIVSQATSSSGATVRYNVSSTDNLDGFVPVDCAPRSGSEFSFGTHDVKCAATDAHGNRNEESFTVRVNSAMDTSAPILTLPSDMITKAASLSGAKVYYNVTADDNNEGFISADCSPASGTTFSLGSTTVICTATDSHGNKAQSSFTITVTF